MRHIYTKIFLWFWMTMIGVVVSITVIAALTGAQPLGRRWLSRTIDYYGNSAVDIYTHGGTSQLAQYFDDIRTNSGIRAALFDPAGRDILGHGIPFPGETLLERARETGETQVRIGARWTGASAIHRSDGLYILVVQVDPWRGIVTPSWLSAVMVRFAIALLAAGILCWVLARHIAEPIQALRAAAGKIAAGDLSVRATPAIAPRNDELADLAADFDRMAERIESLLAKQQELFGDISHELRSPLARLGVSLELVRRGEMDAVERMQTDLDRLDRMIGQILTLTRLQSSAPRSAESKVSLRAIVQSVADDARFEGKEAGKSVEFRASGDFAVTAEPALLRSCVENVVRNALRHTPPGSQIEIELRGASVASGSRALAEVTVRDNGPGVPEESLARLFEPFYRVSVAREHSTGGSGLGLSIAQRVAALYGGAIAAKNRPGGGLEVTIRLPVATGV